MGSARIFRPGNPTAPVRACSCRRATSAGSPCPDKPIVSRAAKVLYKSCTAQKPRKALLDAFFHGPSMDREQSETARQAFCATRNGVLARRDNSQGIGPRNRYCAIERSINRKLALYPYRIPERCFSRFSVTGVEMCFLLRFCFIDLKRAVIVVRATDGRERHPVIFGRAPATNHDAARCTPPNCGPRSGAPPSMWRTRTTPRREGHSA